MVRAIDIHVHPPGPPASAEEEEERRQQREVGERYIGPRAAGRNMLVEELAEYYAGMDMMAVLLHVRLRDDHRQPADAEQLHRGAGGEISGAVHRLRRCGPLEG